MNKLEEIKEFEIEQSPFKVMELHSTMIPIRARHDISPFMSPIQVQFGLQTTQTRSLDTFSSLL